MKTNKTKLIICLLLAMVMGISACSDEFDESEFIKEQADLAEGKSAKDHQRALAVIQAQLDATLVAIQAQAAADQTNDAARIAAQLAADEALAELQSMLTKELERLQYSLKSAEDSTAAANYLEAYRAAGLFTEFTANIVSDDTPLAGVVVSLSSIPDPVTTNAVGQAIFKDVVVGVNRMKVTSSEYLDMQADLTFNRLGVMRLGTTTVVQPATASMTLSLLSETLADNKTATISGVVTIETDLTNDKPEFPAALTISADLTDYVNSNGAVSVNGINYPNNIAFTEGELGVTTVDPATGAYTMLVPVSENGTNIKLIFPEIKANQKIAIAQRDDTVIPAEIASVPTMFSLDNNNPSNVGSVRGYDIVTNNPATPGTGLTLEYNPSPITLTNGFFNSSNLRNSNGQIGFYSTAVWTYRLTSVGSAYTGSPALMFGAKAIGFGLLKGYVNTLTVTNAGTGYGNAQNVQLQLIANLKGGGTTLLGSKNILSTATGTLPATITVDDNDLFGKNNPFTNNQEITSFEIKVVGNNNDAVVKANLTTSLHGFIINDAPKDKFTSAPTFTFTGGGTGATQATLSINALHQHIVTISNAGTGYTIMPDDIVMKGDRVTSFNGSFVSGVTGDVEVWRNGVNTNNNSNLLNSMELNRNGGIRFNNQDNVYYTAYFYESKPETVITDTRVDKFDTRFVINNEGEIVNSVIQSVGDGYDQARSLSIVPRLGATGSGAEFRIDEFFDASSGEYFYQGFTTVNSGKDYVNDINRSTQGPNTNSRITLFSLKPGQSQTRDVVYGTGVRLENVAGDKN
ncbi:hypothetical protein ACV07N_02385 [Roseivirga echinicomitans]